MPLAELAPPHCSHPSWRYQSQTPLETQRHAPCGLHTRPASRKRRPPKSSPPTPAEYRCSQSVDKSSGFPLPANDRAKRRVYERSVTEFFLFCAPPPLKPDKKPHGTEPNTGTC